MNVKRIVSNIASSDVERATQFYRDIFGLELLMDLGWIRTYGSDHQMTIQISIASEGGSETASRIYRLKLTTSRKLWRESRKHDCRLSTGPSVSRGECGGSTSGIHFAS